MNSFVAPQAIAHPMVASSPGGLQKTATFGVRWTESLSLALEHQVADKALTNQLALLVLERSDVLYQVPQYKARVLRWVLAVDQGSPVPNTGWDAQHCPPPQLPLSCYHQVSLAPTLSLAQNARLSSGLAQAPVHTPVLSCPKSWIHTGLS